MGNKLMIINWKFNDLLDKECKFHEVEVDGYDKRKILKLKYYLANKGYLKTKLKKIIEKYSEYEILLLLHTNDEQIPKDEIKLSEFNMLKAFNFCGGDGRKHKIYCRKENNKKGILGDNNIDENARISKEQDSPIKKENFDFVWREYWTANGLEGIKRRIINLWLPLAIDIQGIKDFSLQNYNKNDGKNRYYEDFLSNIKNKKEQLAKEWNIILKDLKDIVDTDRNELQEFENLNPLKTITNNALVQYDTLGIFYSFPNKLNSSIKLIEKIQEREKSYGSNQRNNRNETEER